MIFKYFLPFSGLSFYSVNILLMYNFFFNFLEVQLVHFTVLPVPLVSYPRNYSQTQCHDVFVLFSSKIFAILGLIVFC